MELQRRALQKLVALHAASALDEIGRIPGNRLEKPSGSRRGQYSIRVNDQWRIDVVRGRRGITADTAMRLARYFGVSEQILDEPAISLRTGGRQGSVWGSIGSGDQAARRLMQRDRIPRSAPPGDNDA